LALLQAKQWYQSYRSATTHLVTLRKAVDDCSIRAPFDGWVAERNVSVGERVIAIFPGAKLVTMLRIDPLRLSLTVPEQEMAAVKAGQTVTFRTDAFPGRTFQGTVRYITPQLISDSRSLCVEAVVPNTGAVLRPGLFVTAELHLDQRQTELYVPQAAVASRGDVAAVFVVRGGVIGEQIVSVGETAAGRVRIRSGLSPGEVVVTTPQGVHDGDPVKR
jgi:membrane fusion protein (multidrug efflux system)